MAENINYLTKYLDISKTIIVIEQKHSHSWATISFLYKWSFYEKGGPKPSKF